jgi:hypothetical protein
MSTQAHPSGTGGPADGDMVAAADTAFTSLLLMAALHWKRQHGVGEALRLWSDVEAGRITLHFDVAAHASHTIIKGLMHEAGQPEGMRAEMMTLTLLAGESHPGGVVRGNH